MGLRGPVGKPPELRALEGNRGHRALDLTSMFRPEVGAPSIPKHLNAEARKAWKRLTPELIRYNLLSKIDADALAMLCRTIGRLEVAERSINAKMDLLIATGEDPALAMVGLTPNGMQVQSVTYQIVNKEMEKLRNLLAEFGLTPAQRARVSTAVRVQANLFDINDGRPAKPAGPVGFAEFD